MRYIFAFFLILFAMTFSEQIYLKDGDILSGNILNETPWNMTLHTETSTRSIHKIDIQSIMMEPYHSSRTIQPTINTQSIPISYWGNNQDILLSHYSGKLINNQISKLTSWGTTIIPFPFMCMYYNEKNYLSPAKFNEFSWFWTWGIACRASASKII